MTTTPLNQTDPDLDVPLGRVARTAGIEYHTLYRRYARGQIKGRRTQHGAVRIPLTEAERIIRQEAAKRTVDRRLDELAAELMPV